MNNTISNPPLTRRQLKIIPLLISENTLSAGAERAGIARSTLYRWLDNQDFKAELQRQCRQHVENASIEIRSSMGRAVAVLTALLDSENEQIRLRAGVEILTHVSRFIELEDVEDRLEALEEKAKTA